MRTISIASIGFVLLAGCSHGLVRRGSRQIASDGPATDDSLSSVKNVDCDVSASTDKLNDVEFDLTYGGALHIPITKPQSDLFQVLDLMKQGDTCANKTITRETCQIVSGISTLNDVGLVIVGDKEEEFWNSNPVNPRQILSPFFHDPAGLVAYYGKLQQVGVCNKAISYSCRIDFAQDGLGTNHYFVIYDGMKPRKNRILSQVSDTPAEAEQSLNALKKAGICK